jgi:hypothetical protein
MRVTVLLVVALVTFGMSAVGLAPAHAADAKMDCRGVYIPVALTPAQPDDVNAQMYAEFCLPRYRTTHTVQLLVHGAGYNHLYWDFPYENPYYSYVDHAVSAGYATLDVDRIGTGKSSHPDSSQIAFPSTIFTIHQVITDLRSGCYAWAGTRCTRPFGIRFDNVIEVGHSFGSAYVVDEAATYADADALILTGYGHQTSPSFAAAALGDVYPAVDDPKFADSVLDSGYLTSKPGESAWHLYYAPGADPNVMALDEELKDTVALAEFTSRPNTSTLTPTVHVPTLIFDGQHDVHYCATDADDCSTEQSFYQAESAYFGTDACLRTMVMPETGHDVALHYTTPISDRMMLAWAYQTLPPDAHTARCYGTGPLVSSLPSMSVSR